MFSYFRNGVKDKNVQCTIDIEILQNLVTNNPNIVDIHMLHSLEYGSPKYKSLKEKLPVITPHGEFWHRCITENFTNFSGYLYFDIDASEIKNNPLILKEELIKTYGKLISMMGLSVGGRGLFFYVAVKAREAINTSNFENVYNYVKINFFNLLPTDKHAKGICRPHIIPSDPNVFKNEDAIIEIPEYVFTSGKENITNNIKGRNTYIKKEEKRGYRCTPTFLPIDEVYRKLKFETHVDVANPIFDIKPVEYNKLYIPRIIKDGQKHKVYSAMTNLLVHLNPEAELLAIQSFINWVNENYTAGKPMKKQELINTVSNIFHQTKNKQIVLSKSSIKRIHFNRNCGLSGNQKRKIASMENGKLKMTASINRIKNTIKELQKENAKITRKSVGEKSNLHICTVKKHWSRAMQDLQMLSEQNIVISNS